jgi:hypothetical protein
MISLDMKEVGPGRKYGTPQEAFDAQTGKYFDKIDTMPMDSELLPTKQMPMAPAPMPFAMGPMLTGER